MTSSLPRAWRSVLRALPLFLLLVPGVSSAQDGAPAPAPSSASAPVDAGFTQPSAHADGQPLTAVGDASYAPGLGFVQGGDAALGNVKTDGTASKLSLPVLDQSSVWDNRRFRYNGALSYSDYKFAATTGQKKLGGLLLDLHLGMSLPLFDDLLVPSVDLGVSGGKFGESPHVLFISGGDYELWNVNGDARFGLDLHVSIFQLGGFGGAFLNYYSPSLENLPSEPGQSGKDAGPLYGARARIGDNTFLELSYTWRVGEHATGRYRRIEFGALDDEGAGWSFFWDAREQPGVAPNTASQDERLIGGMPLNYSLGFSLRNY